MNRRMVLLALAIVLVPAAAQAAQDFCMIVSAEGRDTRLDSWNRLVAWESEAADRPGAGAHESGNLDAPGLLTAFLYRGVVIPIGDVSYLMPSLGVYVLRDGHRIEANPLSGCGYSRAHRIVDLERPTHYSTAAGVEQSSHPDEPLLLEVFVEHAAADTVAGYAISEPQMVPVHDARLVVFDEAAVADALQDLSREDAALTGDLTRGPYVARARTRTTVWREPEGEEAGKILRGTGVQVLEVKGGWARVRVEGWVEKDVLEEREP